jgi:hypothetical protein
MMNEVVTEIKRLNAQARAWAAESEGRYAGMLVEDPAHWARYGITTVAGLNEYFDECDAKEERKASYDW